MTLTTPLPASQTDLVLRLESKPGPDTSQKIREVLECSLNKGTVVYGLRALSRMGVDNSELEAIAGRFNGRLAQLTGPGEIFHRKDPPYITSYVVEYIREKFDRVYLTGIIP